MADTITSCPTGICPAGMCRCGGKKPQDQVPESTITVPEAMPKQNIDRPFTIKGGPSKT